jgi:uncharacterized membrane protein YsdA (DUF1294 family)
MKIKGNFPAPIRRSRPAVVWRLAAAGLLTSALLLAVALGRMPSWLLIYAPVLGAVSALAYWIDKRAARRGDWRVPENRLHALDLIGGIAGGLVAQVVLRHKTSKPEFSWVSATIAALHLGILGELILRLSI